MTTRIRPLLRFAPCSWNKGFDSKESTLRCSVFNPILKFFSITLIALAFHSVHSPVSFAQDLPEFKEPLDNGEAAPLLDDLDFTAAQEDRAAKIVVTDTNKFIEESEMVRDATIELRDSLLISLAEKRIEELASADQLSESNFVQRLFKKGALKNLLADQIEKIDFTTEEGLREVGLLVYNQRVIQGLNLKEFAVTVNDEKGNLIGIGEPTSIDKKIRWVVTHWSGVEVAWFDHKSDLDTPHAKQLIARKQYLSNKGKGRPFVALIRENYQTVNDGTTYKVKMFERMANIEDKKARKKIKWTADYVKPDAGAYAATAISVIGQVGIAYLISGIDVAMHPAKSLDHITPAVSVVFGTIFGVFGSYYKNITTPADSHNPTARILAMSKRLVLSSATFAYTLHIARNHGDLSDLTFFTTGGWLNHLALWGNITASNIVRDQWVRINEMREDTGLARGSIKIPGTGVTMRRSQIERQLLYISQNGIKILDQVGFEIPVGVTELPFGRFLNYGSVIAVPGINVRIAKKIGYRNADLVEEKWNNILGTPERALRWALNSTVLVANGYHKLFTSPREFALEAWETLADTKKGIANFIDNCGDLLRGKKTQEALPFRVTEDGEWLEFSTGQ